MYLILKLVGTKWLWNPNFGKSENENLPK